MHGCTITLKNATPRNIRCMWNHLIGLLELYQNIDLQSLCMPIRYAMKKPRLSRRREKFWPVQLEQPALPGSQALALVHLRNFRSLSCHGWTSGYQDFSRVCRCRLGRGFGHLQIINRLHLSSLRFNSLLEVTPLTNSRPINNGRWASSLFGRNSPCHLAKKAVSRSRHKHQYSPNLQTTTMTPYPLQKTLIILISQSNLPFVKILLEKRWETVWLV